jgi:hypothetical protein
MAMRPAFHSSPLREIERTMSSLEKKTRAVGDRRGRAGASTSKYAEESRPTRTSGAKGRRCGSERPIR